MKKSSRTPVPSLPLLLPPPLAWYGVSWAYTDTDDTDNESVVPSETDSETLDDQTHSVPIDFGPDQEPGQGRGMVLGRFLPPHRGHQYVIDFARAFAGEITILLRVSASDPIPGATRGAWLRELFPEVRVVSLVDQPGETDAMAIARWVAAVQELAQGVPDYLFGSDIVPGQDFAARVGARWIPVDPARQVIPISGSRIRTDPRQFWEFLPVCVRPWYVRRVCIIGPERSGKTTLAQRLAQAFNTVAGPEYARAFLSNDRGYVRPWEATDSHAVARGQMAVESALDRQSNRVVFYDTDLRSVRLWCERRFNRAPDWVTQEAERRLVDLHLLLDPEGVNEDRSEIAARRAFYDRCAVELTERGLPFVRLGGSGEERFAAARTAVRQVLASPYPE